MSQRQRVGNDREPLLTPTEQERALIAMLRELDYRRLHPDKVWPVSQIKIAIFHGDSDDFDNADDDDAERPEVATWGVGISPGGWELHDGTGDTFAEAWDAMVRNGDRFMAHGDKSLKKTEPSPNLSDLVRSCLEEMKSPLTPQEIELTGATFAEAAERLLLFGHLPRAGMLAMDSTPGPRTKSLSSRQRMQ